MKKWSILLGFIGFVFIWSCTSQPKNKNEDIQEVNSKLQSDSDVLAKGFTLLESNCFTCHSPSNDMNNRIAPPMFAVKRHYIDAGYNKAEFIESIADYVQNPSEEKAIMPGAIEKFGVMPKMNFSKEDLEAISIYLYETELEEADWFEKHYQEERKKYIEDNVEAPLSYQEKGLKFAMATKAVLGKNLLGAIQTKGTEGALTFCNVQAYPLTDSMSENLKAYIKRVSDKNRNPDNVANEKELAYIHSAKQMLLDGKEIIPQVSEIDNKMVGYYPILTNKMCLQCHGKLNEDLKPETLAKIKTLYPDDQAIGYGENELRGIWVVEMDK